jgi:hypothetical protein
MATTKRRNGKKKLDSQPLIHQEGASRTSTRSATCRSA